MAPSLSIYKLTPSDSAHWSTAMQIYRDAFPEWEREPEEIIHKRVNSGRYAMYCGQKDNDVIGFYILDIDPKHHYVFFCFLAVVEDCRGQGYGTYMCRDAITRFYNEYDIDWLLIEAEERQAIFYGQLGFKKFDMPYQVPKYNAPDSVPMHLMAISANINQDSIDKPSLSQLIADVFVSGYHLSMEDARITQQIAAIPDNVKLINWPQ